jgi:hypothetical protein
MPHPQIVENASSKLLRAMELIEQAQEILLDPELPAQIQRDYDSPGMTARAINASVREHSEVLFAANGCLRGARAIIWPQYLA